MQRQTVAPTWRVLAAVSVALCLLAADVAWACPDCATSDEVWLRIGDNFPQAVLGILTLAFVCVGALIVGTTFLAHKARLLLAGALLLGAGLGSFIDGILLHQVLQWHAMLSNVVTPVDLVTSKVNMFWDGMFHLYAWIVTVVALVIVVRELPRVDRRVITRTMAGGALAGWGYFNVVEGIIDHHIFVLHHVRPGTSELVWDVGFLAFGALLVAIGGAVSLRSLRVKTIPL